MGLAALPVLPTTRSGCANSGIHSSCDMPVSRAAEEWLGSLGRLGVAVYQPLGLQLSAILRSHSLSCKRTTRVPTFALQSLESSGETTRRSLECTRKHTVTIGDGEDCAHSRTEQITF